MGRLDFEDDDADVIQVRAGLRNLRIEGFDIDAVADGGDCARHGLGGVLEQIVCAGVRAAARASRRGGLKWLRTAGGARRLRRSFSAAEVEFVFERDRDGKRGAARDGEIAVQGGDAIGRGWCGRKAARRRGRRDVLCRLRSGRRSRENPVRTDDALHGQTEGAFGELVAIRELSRDSSRRRGAGVPGHAVARWTTLSPLSALMGMARSSRIPSSLGESVRGRARCVVEDFLRVVDEVHLVDGGDDVRVPSSEAM